MGTPGSVLGSTAGNELGRVVVQEIFIDVQVLLFRKDSIIGLQAILGEERIVTLSLDICKNDRQ